MYSCKLLLVSDSDLLLDHNGQTFMNSIEWSNKIQIQSNLEERISFSLHSPDSVFAQLPTALFTISAVAARVAKVFNASDWDSKKLRPEPSKSVKSYVWHSEV